MNVYQQVKELEAKKLKLITKLNSNAPNKRIQRFKLYDLIQEDIRKLLKVSKFNIYHGFYNE